MTDRGVRIASEDRSAVVELDFDKKRVRVEFANPELPYRGSAKPASLIFQTDVTEPQFEAAWTALQGVAAGTSAEPDQHVRMQWLGQRGLTVLSAQSRRLIEVARWLLNSQETTNHTYAISDISKKYLAHTVAAVTGVAVDVAAAYIREAENDENIVRHVLAARAQIPADRRALSDPAVRLGRRLGWYAVVRASKPALVVETGVDKGLGAVVLCAALLRNRAEGREGRYIGTDINPHAGYLLSGPYAEVGRVAYGDSLDTLTKLDQKIGVFINDSDHALDYEAKEYAAVREKLAPGAVILSDNATSTAALADFAVATNRKFLFWREQPIDHWYGGGAIGFAFEGR